jgi:hypothetical protein
MTNRQWLALQIAGTVLFIALILAAGNAVGAILRMWGVA